MRLGWPRWWLLPQGSWSAGTAASANGTTHARRDRVQIAVRTGQVVRELTQADQLLAEGKEVADVRWELQITEATCYRWRNQFGGLKADDAKRLKDLERENATLKRLLADAESEKAALKEAAKGNF